VAVTAIGASLLLTASPALAHEQRQVGGYQFTVGWQHEPTYVGSENAVQIVIKDAKGTPVDDLGSPPSLQVTVTAGSQTSKPLNLAASFDPDTGFGTRGEFDAAIIPTSPGDYTFHIAGTINGQPVDEKFTSGPKTFDTVHDPTEAQFPAKVPSPSELGALTNRLTPRVDATVAQAKSNASDTRSAHDLALVGVILGAAGVAIGLALGGGGLIAARRARRRPEPA
jgi:hypothetical protein